MHTPLLQAMFHLEPSVAEKILRPILIYVFLIAGLRLSGKRELAQLNPFDLVVLLTISNTVQNAIIGEDNSVIGGLIGAATLLLVNHIVARVVYNSDRLARVIEGSPTLLIDKGELHEECLAQELIAKDELELAAHKQGFASLTEVDRAELDPGGSIAFLAKRPTPDEARHEDIMKRLDQLSAQVAALHA